VSTIDKLRALLKAASPGPWTRTPPPNSKHERFMVWDANGDKAAEMGFCVEPEGNAALIAATINALPRLLDVVEAAKHVQDSRDGGWQVGGEWYDALENMKHALDALEGGGT